MNCDYDIKHADGKKILLVGQTLWNQEVLHTVKLQHDVDIISLEDFDTLDNKDQYAYFTAGADTAFKKKVVEQIESFVGINAFVSFVSKNSHIHPDTVIGRNTLICPYVCISAPSEIGNHCVVSHYSCMVHNRTNIKDYCFIGPYVTMVDCEFEKGTWIGHHCRFLRVKTKEWSQFYMHSRVTNCKFEISGTFKNTKLMDGGNSLTNTLKD